MRSALGQGWEGASVGQVRWNPNIEIVLFRFLQQLAPSEQNKTLPRDRILAAQLGVPHKAPPKGWVFLVAC